VELGRVLIRKEQTPFHHQNFHLTRKGKKVNRMEGETEVCEEIPTDGVGGGFIKRKVNPLGLDGG